MLKALIEVAEVETGGHLVGRTTTHKLDPFVKVHLG